MEKVAEMVKVAEISGVLAALMDSGHVKLASDEDFDTVVAAVSGQVSDKYDLGEVLDKTAEVMGKVAAFYTGDGDAPAAAAAAAPAASESTPATEKLASEGEEDVRAAMAAYGELTLLKEAGEITAENFVKEAAPLQAILNAAKAAKGAVSAKAPGLANFLSNAKPGAMKGNLSNLHGAVKNRNNMFYGKGFAQAQGLKALKGLGKGAVPYVAGAAGGAAGAKALYEKYKK